VIPEALRDSALKHSRQKLSSTQPINQDPSCRITAVKAVVAGMCVPISLLNLAQIRVYVEPADVKDVIGSSIV
jgi:hypothetical protein